MHTTCSTLFVKSSRASRTKRVKKNGTFVSLFPFKSSASTFTHNLNVRGSTERWLKAKSTLWSSVRNPISGGSETNWFSEKSRCRNMGSCEISRQRKAIRFLRNDKRVRVDVCKIQSGMPARPREFCWTDCRFDIQRKSDDYSPRVWNICVCVCVCVCARAFVCASVLQGMRLLCMGKQCRTTRWWWLHDMLCK
jgi:hypothetical protein